MSRMNDLISVISNQGQNVVSGNQYDMIQVWLSWYRGNVNSFHRYTKYSVTGTKITLEKLTFGGAKKVAEDWRSLLWNEKVKLKTNNEQANERLEEVLKDNNFNVEFGELIEKVFGYAGTGALIEYLSDGKTIIDYITGDNLIITQGSNTTARGLITVNVIEDENEWITHVTIHTLKDGEYIIEHQAYVSNKDSELGDRQDSALYSIFDEETVDMMETLVKDEDGNVDTKYLVIYETDVAMFQIIKPNITNHYDIRSKMGVPVISNSIDNLKALDTAYDALNNENENNKTNIFFDVEATKKRTVSDAETGQISYVNYIDQYDTRFIGTKMKDGDKTIHHVQGNFDSESYVKSLKEQLNMLSFKCGLGTEYYNTNASGEYVNEKQVVSSNSDLWRNKVNHEIILEKALEGMIKAVLWLESSEAVDNPISLDVDSLEVEINFDDSIIQDDQTDRQNDMEAVNAGIRTKAWFNEKWYGETPTQAEAMVTAAQEESGFNSLFTEEEEVEEE